MGSHHWGSGPKPALSLSCLSQAKLPHKGMLFGTSDILSHISDAFKWILLTSHTPQGKLCLHYCELRMDVLTVLWEWLTFVTTWGVKPV